MGDTHIHIHLDGPFEEILTHLRALRAQGEQLMAVSQEIKDSMARIDAATNTIAIRLQVLAEKINTSMSSADVQEVVTGLNATATQLEGLGHDPENPVPTT